MIRVVGFLLLMLFVGGTGAWAARSVKSNTGYIPEVLVSFEKENGTEYAVIVEKKTQSLFLYSFNGLYRKVFHLSSSTGENMGAKTHSGDKKTPEGIYFFTKEHQKKDLAPIYGSRAFPMDYPNLLDQIAGRDGNSIWMHGTNKPLKPRDSNGCVALKNPDIDKLAKYITLNRTPIIIVDKLSYTSARSVARVQKSILDFIGRWRISFEQGTYHEYLKHYDADYVPDISWWPDWNRIKKTTRQSSPPLSVELKKVMVLKHKDVYVALFDQFVRTADKKLYAGTRKLFLRNQNFSYKIIGDVYQVLPKKRKKIKQENPLVVAARELKKPPKVVASRKAKKRSIKVSKRNREIPEMLNNWLKAWSAKDIKKYGSFYSKNFRSQGGGDRRSWLKYKSRINRKYKYIRVSMKNLTVKKGKNRSIATFVQNYDSSSFKTVGTKKLILIREKGRWKIYRETWRKS